MLLPLRDQLKQLHRAKPISYSRTLHNNLSWAQLQHVQNAAAHVVTVSPKFCHITPVLKNLHWLPIDLRIEFKILTITYKALHDLAPAYIKNLLKNYYPPRDLRSSKKNLLVVPAFRTNSYGRRAFFCCCAASLEQSSSTHQGCWIT